MHPDYLFCLHYHHKPDERDWDCIAFHEIPDCIFVGGFTHIGAIQGDGGVRFELNPDYQEAYIDVEDLRRQIMQSLSAPPKLMAKINIRF